MNVKKTKISPRMLEKDISRALLTRVEIGGKVVGAAVCSADKTSSVFVEKKDFRYLGDIFLRLYREEVHTPQRRARKK